MICKQCDHQFNATHWNQKLCSDICRHESRIEVKDRFKKSEKGKLCERRWRQSETKRTVDRRYYTSNKGRAAAVKRFTRLVKSDPYYLMRKRLGQTAAYRKLRDELISAVKKCQSCQSCKDLTIDHIIPMSLGGKHEQSNIQILCRSCNSRKKQRIERYAMSQV